MSKEKYFKKRPKHLFYREVSTNTYIGITPLGSSVHNHIQLYHPDKDKKKSGAFTMGVFVGADWEKITEDEFVKVKKIYDNP